jgi:hypothetical protein
MPSDNPHNLFSQRLGPALSPLDQIALLLLRQLSKKDGERIQTLLSHIPCASKFYIFGF